MNTRKDLLHYLLCMYISVCVCVCVCMCVWMNAMYAVSLANHLRAVADAFRPLRTHQRY